MEVMVVARQAFAAGMTCFYGIGFR